MDTLFVDGFLGWSLSRAFSLLTIRALRFFESGKTSLPTSKYLFLFVALLTRNAMAADRFFFPDNQESGEKKPLLPTDAAFGAFCMPKAVAVGRGRI